MAGYVNLGVAENTLMHDVLIEQMKRIFEPSSSALSYGEGPGGSLRLRQAIAAFVNRFFSPVVPVEPNHVTVSNGVTLSIERCAFALGDPRDCFLLGTPFYGSFQTELGDRAKVDILPVTFGGVDPLSEEAVARFEEEIFNARLQSKKVRALLLCSPHNPLGRCYPRKTLVALMKLCQTYSIHLIVDEIYALSVFSNPEYMGAQEFTSVLNIGTTGLIDPGLIHVLWGLSKDFGANGLRIGCVISQSNPKLSTALIVQTPHSYPSALLDHVASCLLEDFDFVDGYIAENQRRLAENYVFVRDFLHQHDVPFYPGSNAGFFFCVDLGEAWLRRKGAKRHLFHRDFERERDRFAIDHRNRVSLWQEKGPRFDLTHQVMERLVLQRVYLANGDDFGSELPGWFRIVFTLPRHLVVEGLRRIMCALDM